MVKSPPTAPDPVEPTTRSFMLMGRQAGAERLSPGLHVVATPIGNLRDISIRAIGALAAADVILAEDTRVTKTLLAHYGVTTPMIAYHEHNAARVRPQIMARLAKGEAIVLVSDAGTPLVSDPGYKLVADVIQAGARVSTIPGASAVLAALAIAGLPTDRFLFEGFLPPKSAARRARLKELAQASATLVFFESPQRVADMIGDAAAMLGARQAVIARELTKLHEEAIRGSLAELAHGLASGPPLRGEIVIVVAPPDIDAERADEATALDDLLRDALQGASFKQAVADVTAKTGQPRRVVYARALALAGRS